MLTNIYRKILFSLFIGISIILITYACTKVPERCDVMKSCRTCDDCMNNENCRNNCLYCSDCEVCSNFSGNEVIVPEYIVNPGMIFAPCYHPNNNDEIAYFKQDTSTGSMTLNTYNFNTQKENTILSNALVYGPNPPQIKWYKPHLLSFIRTDGNIYTVNTENGEVKNITRIPTFTHHTWINDTTIVAELSLNGGNSYYNKAIINANTGEIDTTKNDYFKFGTYLTNGSYVYVKRNDSKNIFIKYPNEEERRITDNILPDRDSITGLALHPDMEQIFFTTYRSGIYSVNIALKKTNKIRAGCDTRSYRNITISPDGKQMVVQRIDAHENTTEAKWIETHCLYRMDINGKNEMQIVQ